METSKQKERPKYWILGWNEPQRMSGSKPKEEVKYPSKGPSRQRSNVDNVKEGEVVVGYEGGKGYKGIVSLLIVKKENDGKQVMFEKVENFASPIAYNVMERYSDLKDIAKNKIRGLHELTKEEYDFIIEMANESIEEADDIPYQKEVQSAIIADEADVPDNSHLKPEEGGSKGSPIVKRNAKIAKYTLAKAGYNCAIDPSHKTFASSKGLIYMEAHHLIPCIPTNAKKYWREHSWNVDSKSNIVCLCPTCHRGIHYGDKATKRGFITKLYNQQKEKYKAAGLNITLDELLELYKVK